MDERPLTQRETERVDGKKLHLHREEYTTRELCFSIPTLGWHDRGATIQRAYKRHSGRILVEWIHSEQQNNTAENNCFVLSEIKPFFNIWPTYLHLLLLYHHFWNYFLRAWCLWSRTSQSFQELIVSHWQYWRTGVMWFNFIVVVKIQTKSTGNRKDAYKMCFILCFTHHPLKHKHESMSVHYQTFKSNI